MLRSEVVVLDPEKTFDTLQGEGVWIKRHLGGGVLFGFWSVRVKMGPEIKWHPSGKCNKSVVV